MVKLNRVLAVVEQSTPVFRKLVGEYKLFFEKKQGEFAGVRKTYTPREGTKDEPSMRQFKKVVTTVDEKLEYLVDHAKGHLKNIMDIEATNASGTARVELIVEWGDRKVSFGKLSTLELLKLRSVLEKEGLEAMYAAIPVRSDSERWVPTTDEEYTNRSIYETPLHTGVNGSIEKEEYILEDPNLKNMTDTSRYTPLKSVRSKNIELGDYTLQHFSGEKTHTYRASILDKRSKILEAISGAIKEANDTPIVESELDPQKLFDFLHDSK